MFFLDRVSIFRKIHPNSLKMISRFLFLIVNVIFIISCNTNDNDTIRNDDKELLSFQIEADINSKYISETIIGSVKDNTIRLVVPEVIDKTKLIATFEFVGKSVYVNDVEQKSRSSSNDLSKPVFYEVYAEDESVEVYDIQVVTLPSVQSNVPHLYIETDNRQPIDSKENYIHANLTIEGKGVYDDYQGRTKIRGRGNDSWNQPKKPYKLKLDDKVSLLGLLPEKKWILRSNYRGESLMLDAIGFRIAALLGMPYTNHAIPVDVTVNGQYQGSYMFTEQKEAKPNRINVVDGGKYLDLDSYMNKPPGQFYSDYYELPVMVRYPSFKELSPSDAQRELELIKADFHNMEKTIADESFPNNNFLDYFEALDFVNYMIVYHLTLNREINHPKSTYMHKHKGGKYKMGPVWDFDWGFGYNSQLDTHFNTPEQNLFVDSDMPGKVFFTRLLEDATIQNLYRKQWQDFKENSYPELIDYIESYANTIQESYALDYAIWEQGVGSSEEAAQQIINWLNVRVQYMDVYVSEL